MDLGSVATWQGWGFVSVVIAVPALLVALVALYPILQGEERNYVEQLGDPADRKRLKAELLENKTALENYLVGVVKVRAWLDRTFGPPWSWQAFDRCLQIALVYPIVLLLVAWTLGAPGQIGDLAVLPDLPVWRRAGTLIVVLVTAIATFWWFRLEIPDRFGRWASRSAKSIVPRAMRQRNVSWLADVVEIMAGAVAFVGAVAVAVAFAGVGAGVGAVAFAFAFAVAGVGAVAVAGVGAGVGAVAVAGVVAVAVAVQWLVFLAALPVGNAALDWLSWWVTRFLLAHIDRSRRGATGLVLAAAAILVDVLTALLCLVTLCALIALILEATNAAFAALGWPEFDWRSQMRQAIETPFTAGLMVTGMLVTTIVPTVIHLAVGIGHVFAAWLPDRKSAATRIADTMSTGDKQAVAKVLVRRKLCYIPGGATALLMVVCLGFAIKGVFGSIAEPLGLVAECSASLVGGECRWPEMPLSSRAR